MYILPPGAPSASLSFLLSVIVAALLCPVPAGPTTPPDRDTAGSQNISSTQKYHIGNRSAVFNFLENII